TGQVLRAETRRLLAHPLDQLRPLDPLREAGEVLHVGRETELPARLVAVDQERLQVGAGGVDRRRQAGAPRPQDDDASGVRGRSRTSLLLVTSAELAHAAWLPCPLRGRTRASASGSMRADIIAWRS